MDRSTSGRPRAIVPAEDDDCCPASDRYFVGDGIRDPRHTKSCIEDLNGGLYNGTCQAILESDGFQRWRDDRKKRLLWIKGEPGTGKTMQLCSIINELENATGRGVFLSFFFCEGPDARSNSATAVLRGLVYLLVQHHPQLAKHLHKKPKAKGKTASENDSSWARLSDIFVHILKDSVLKARGARFVIDALDECVTGLPNLLDLIARTVPKFHHVKWIISSGTSSAIEQKLGAHVQETGSLFQCSSEALAAARGAYIQHRVRQLADTHHYSTEIEAAIRDQLSDEGETLLWAALACRSLADLASGGDILSELRAFPQGLDPFYTHMLRKVESSSYGEACKSLLAVTAAVSRPLRIQELSLLLETPGESVFQDAESLIELVRHCGAILTLRDNTVYFVHRTARDFLVASYRATDSVFAVRMDEVDAKILSKSLEAMSKTLQRDMYHLQKAGTTTAPVRCPDLDPLEAVRYSCVHWIYHLCGSYQATRTAATKSDAGDRTVNIQSVHEFLRQYFLYWVEALSLIGCIPEGLRALEALEKLLEQTESGTELLNLVCDARRFVAAHSPILGQAPLQTYVTALVFTPVTSRIRKLFKAEEPGWLIASVGVESATPEDGHHSDPVWSLAFSPANSETAATASDDKTIKIWNTKTGACSMTLKGHEDSVRSITFSHNGREIASASDDGTVHIWDIAKGKCIQIVDGHCRLLRSTIELKRGRSCGWGLAFSHNGEQLAWPSGEDGDIDIRDPATGECLQKLKGHSSEVLAAAFCHNSKLISGSADSTVKIWDLATGACLHTLNHDRRVMWVVCSHNGRQLASAGEKVKIWDISTGACLAKLDTKGTPYSVSYSHDDTLLAAGMADGKIGIWSPRTKQCIRTLDGDDGTIVSLYFSRHSWLLASGSNQGIVRVWDAQTGACLYELPYEVGWVESVVFARTDRHVIAVSRKSIGVWSTRTGACLENRVAHDADLRATAISHDGTQLATSAENSTLKLWNVTFEDTAWASSFSRNGKLLATCSDGGKVRIWDLSDAGKRVAVLKLHTHPVYSTTFSNRDQRVAAASEDRTVSIWTIKGQLLRVLKGHAGAVWAVRFSPDDGRIVSTSNDRTLRVWDSSSGVCLQIIDLGMSLSSIAFNDSADSFQTEIGRIQLVDLPQPPSTANTIIDGTGAATESTDQPADDQTTVIEAKRTFKQDGYGLSPDQRWIVHNGENVMWLPPEYRPLSSAVSGDTIGIGCRSGRVLFLTFSSSGS